MDYIYNISEEEALKRTDKEYLTSIHLLDYNSPEYVNLSDSDKQVIYHLCRAGFWIEKIEYSLQNAHNIDFYHYVSNKDDEYSKNVFRLLRAQKSINSLDTNGNMINLAKGISDNKGKNYYHFDMSIEDFHNVISRMLDNGMIEELKKVLSSRSVVEYDGDIFRAIDYVDYFHDEFTSCADELDKASKLSDDKDFASYLSLQAKALRVADPMLDAKADIAWAKLKDSKIEFTITRECYDDELTTSLFANKPLMARLRNANIEVNAKDSLGARVGIVNTEGTKLLDTLSTLNDISGPLMPYIGEYSKSGQSVKSSSQIAVDVDLVAMTGDTGAYRAGITLAENLPNSDKLALKLGGGNRNVYHRQVRTTKSSELYKMLIHEDYLPYYNLEAGHWATIEHENTHSLGPVSGKALGEYSSLLEEYKADMGMYAFLREYEAAGAFTSDQTKQIIVTELYSSFLKVKPLMSQAHRVRSVMITNRMLQEGAIIYKDGKLLFDFDKAIDCARVMLSEVVRLQIDKDIDMAKSYVEKYFVWTDTHEAIAKIIRENAKKLNGEVVAPIYADATSDLVM
ncbi:MAG: hypothetical protein E7361_01135 [Clostridiales bacterium]|nr:hypothetical protein [Clostridiales bacterium]